MSHHKQVGMSCKNLRFIKRGLTADEAKRAAGAVAADRKRWEHLFSLNAWKPVDAAR